MTNSPGLLWGLWIGSAALLLAGAGSLLHFGHLYGYDYLVIQMPILPFVGALIAAGVVFLGVAGLTYVSVRRGLGGWPLLAFIIAVGLLLRAILVFSEPVLEDDYQRYLWDGAVTASGMNPYAVAPSTAAEGQADPAFEPLLESGGVLVDRVNHPHLRTIYPPVAQALFAVAYVIEPFSLTAWKLVCLAGEVATLMLLLLLLQSAGRALIWVTLYWWNPVILKELVNSAHMEAVLMPVVLLGIWFAVRQRPIIATWTLGVAAGIKVWPLILVPLVARPLLMAPVRLVLAGGGLAVLLALWAVPVLIAGLDETSGFVAYVDRWQTNSALFPVLQTAAGGLVGLLGLDELIKPGALARLGIAGTIGLLALGLAWRARPTAADLMFRAGLVCGALYLLSPAQFPWYAAWVLAFLPFVPSLGLLALAVTLPLYYVAFHMMVHGDIEVFRQEVVWVIWVPIWALLLFEAVQGRWRLLADPALPQERDRAPLTSAAE